MKKKYIPIILVLLFGFSCIKNGLKKALFLQNNSNHYLKVYFDNFPGYNLVYPDTLISDYAKDWLSHDFKEIFTENTIVDSRNWGSLYEVGAPKDTISLFIFHSDTLAKYSWEEVRQGYKVLARYDLSLQDIKTVDFILSYPPDIRMEGIKLFLNR